MPDPFCNVKSLTVLGADLFLNLRMVQVLGSLELQPQGFWRVLLHREVRAGCKILAGNLTAKELRREGLVICKCNQCNHIIVIPNA